MCISLLKSSIDFNLSLLRASAVSCLRHIFATEFSAVVKRF
nr:MAG TPA: hypothetical protein [Bacteriophage sp.]